MNGGNGKYVCVCNTENENCIYSVCTSRPGAETLEILLQNELDDMTIEYKQWVVTDRATPMIVTQQSDKLIENLVSKMPELTRHHYTARYLKESKENLQSDQVYRTCTIIKFKHLLNYSIAVAAT
jgi:hypothetical protein